MAASRQAARGVRVGSKLCAVWKSHSDRRPTLTLKCRPSSLPFGGVGVWGYISGAAGALRYSS